MMGHFIEEILGRVTMKETLILFIVGNGILLLLNIIYDAVEAQIKKIYKEKEKKM